MEYDFISNKFNGFRRQFLLTKTIGLVPEPFSIESSDSIPDVQPNLLVFIKKPYQEIQYLNQNNEPLIKEVVKNDIQKTVQDSR